MARMLPIGSPANKPVRLSLLEQRLLALLPVKGQRISTDALVEAFYPGKHRPFNARQIITGRMRLLSRKLLHNRSKVLIHKTARRGPKPIEYWLVGRK